MAIKPKCDKCGKELKEFGGILFSPPNPSSSSAKAGRYGAGKKYGKKISSLPKMLS
jgi:hypothetical protein